MLKEENLRNVQKILKNGVIKSDLVKDYTISPVSSDLNESRQVVRLFQRAWSNNNPNSTPIIDNLDESRLDISNIEDMCKDENKIKELTDKINEFNLDFKTNNSKESAMYFYPNFNNPYYVADIGKKIETFCESNNLIEAFKKIDDLSFVLKKKDKIISLVNLQFDHENQSVEWGRLVTLGGYGKNGYARELFDTATNINKNFFKYLCWSDSNTMHPTTQNLNNIVKSHAVGFSPLKFYIPNHNDFKNQKNILGISNARHIFWDGRVSTTLNQYLLKEHIENREFDAYAVPEVHELQKHVLKKYDLSYQNRSKASSTSVSNKDITSKSKEIEDDSICNWLKIKDPTAFKAESIIKYASENKKVYIEIDVPATKGSIGLQEELIKNSFFVEAYMPGFKLLDNTRVDTVRFGYLTDKHLTNDYLASKDSFLGEVVIPENKEIANIVLGNLERSLNK